ncbi:MAG TPA: chorismate mutase [Myxococcaceae bacterium]|nr:chorismate mutase [Myxococcaceae bacterium]
MNAPHSRCRGIRGATTAAENTAASILEATAELLSRLTSANQIEIEDTAAIFFTATPDLDATFPARAARDLGYVNVPLMCSQEIPVPEAPPRCIRVLMLVNTSKGIEEMVHVYLRGAASLRSDLNPARSG